MWNFFGRPHRYCDGLTRRSFMQVGGLGVGGLTLADLHAAESLNPAGSPSSRHKSVIMVYLSGGMPHQDTFDLKPGAPAEIRGEFNPIATTVSRDRQHRIRLGYQRTPCQNSSGRLPPDSRTGWQLMRPDGVQNVWNAGGSGPCDP
ncbi:MAG: hypothetical protein WKF77_32140 [Planctomycetaceae bacterium]